MPSDVGLIASAVAEVAKVIGNWQVSAERNKLKACIEAGEKYIQVNESEGEYVNLPTTKKDQYLAHFKKRFFHYN